MPSEVGAYEAKTHLPELLKRVARGERITITKHGKPIAHLIPAAAMDIERRLKAIEKLKEFRKGRTLGVPVRQLIEEGRM